MSFLSTTHAAAKLGVSIRTMQLLVKSGQIPATKFGRDWQISEKALTRFTPRPVGRPRKERS